MSVILPNLLLGNVADADAVARGARPDVDAMLTVAAELPYSGIKNYAYIPMADSPTQDLLSNLPDALSFISFELEQGHTVLVHCYAGVSRSASVVIAYLMMARGMSLDQAYAHVKARRPIIHPNPGFMQQLASLKS